MRQRQCARAGREARKLEPMVTLVRTKDEKEGGAHMNSLEKVSYLLIRKTLIGQIKPILLVHLIPQPLGFLSHCLATTYLNECLFIRLDIHDFLWTHASIA